MFKTYSSSSSLVITSRWFATSRLRAPVSVRLVYQQPSIVLDNGLVQNRPRAIIWTNADPIHWCIYVAPGGDELTIRHHKSWTITGSLIHYTSSINTWLPWSISWTNANSETLCPDINELKQEICPQWPSDNLQPDPLLPFPNDFHKLFCIPPLNEVLYSLLNELRLMKE